MKAWTEVVLGVVLGVVLITGIKSCVAPAPPPEKEQIAIRLSPEGASLPGYDTLVEAGIHAGARAVACSEVYECGGAIAQRPDGKFVVGPVSSSYYGDSVNADYGVPTGWKLAAGYHAHPCLPDSHFPWLFSPQDMANAFYMGVPEFVVDQCSGKVHEFDPKVDKQNDVVIEGGRHYASGGRIVGSVPIPGGLNVSKEPDTGL
jgi:hypothetical protein